MSVESVKPVAKPTGRKAFRNTSDATRFPILGVVLCIALMLSLPVMTWIRFVVWLGIGLLIYFLYSVRHSKLRRGIDTGITEDIPPPIIKT